MWEKGKDSGWLAGDSVWQEGLLLGLELPREAQETELAGPGREENGAKKVCMCVYVLISRRG